VVKESVYTGGYTQKIGEGRGYYVRISGTSLTQKGKIGYLPAR
jgi:hypothetical protein